MTSQTCLSFSLTLDLLLDIVTGDDQGTMSTFGAGTSEADILQFFASLF